MAEPTPTPFRPWPARAGAAAVALATLALMLATEPGLSIVWDEGFVLGREARVRSWCRAMLDPPGFASRWEPPEPGSELVQGDGMAAPAGADIDTRGKLLSPRVIAWFWPFSREEPHGHPPFYAIAGLLGDLVAPASWAPLPRARIGPEVAFSLAAGAIFGFVGRRWGRWPACLAAGAWAFQPNLFGHGHYATLDGLLTSIWAGAVLAFGSAVDVEGSRPRWGYVLLFGLLCGWAADTKLTGWFLPLPFLAWSLIFRDRRGWLTIGVGGLVAVLVLYAFNPCWWADPVSGVERFLRSNLTRGRTIPIPVEFLGEIYQTPNDSLPWWNTIAWTVMVTPVGFLGFAIVGAWRAVRGSWEWRKSLVGPPPTLPLPHKGGGDQTGRADAKKSSRLAPFDLPPSPLAGEGRGGGSLPHHQPSAFSSRLAFLVVLHWATLLALRALPRTPGHDGVRLFLPAFGMLAIVAGTGAAGVAGRWGRALVVAAVIEGAASVAVMMPVPLSYFSPIVGGLPGAAALGMEPTYFWDALSEDARGWLDRNTPPGRTVRFSSRPTSWLYLKQTGQLRAPLWPLDPRRPAWYVVQNRPGAFGRPEAALIREGRPAYRVEKLGVPLILIYPLPDGASRP